MSMRPDDCVHLLLRTSAKDSDAWHEAFREALPDARIAIWPDVPFAPDYVAAWRPSAELFAAVSHPKAIFNLGAGVDALLALPTLPDVPVIRLEDAGMARPMAEYVCLAALAAFRQRHRYHEQQRARVWQALPAALPEEFPIGILGLGVLGRACADALSPFGFPLLGWSRHEKSIEGMTTFSGEAGLATLLRRVRMLVCLLPLTSDTRDLLDARHLRQLPRGAHLVNVARGELVVDADLLALLDDGHLATATLDVFHQEPLPAEHPFWHHPGVVLTPHVSATTHVRTSAAQVAAKIRRLEAGEPVTGVVDRARGY
ncbi:MAG: glyoxylate/hydroxypyruvate reductase A [Casimicrobiaceae bacterium]